MTTEFETVGREEISGRELEIIEVAEHAARKSYENFYAYMRSLPQEQLDKLANNGLTSLIYNSIGIFTLELVMALNENNNISQNDALCNLDGLNGSIKTMLSKNWEKIEHVRAGKPTNVSSVIN